MAENKHESGLLSTGTRKPGNYTPQAPATENIESAEKKEEQNSKESVKRSFKYQKRSIKISEDQGLVMDAIGRVNNMKYNYEIIQLLIDNYRDNASENDRRKIDGFVEISK